MKNVIRKRLAGFEDNDSETEDSEHLNIKKRKLFLPNDAVATKKENNSVTKDDDDSKEIVSYEDPQFVTGQEEDQQNDDIDTTTHQPKYTELQKMSRDKGLKKSLFEDSGSKGLSIMEKMGFKVGNSLGLRKYDKDRPSVPITVNVKINNSGIGASSKVEKEPSGVTMEEYHSNVKEKNFKSQQQKTIWKLMKKSFELSGDDDVMDIKTINPLDINVLWREYVINLQENLKRKKIIQLMGESEPQDDEKYDIENDVELQDLLAETPDEIIDKLIIFLRSECYYCFWCGNKFENDEQLLKFCPGPYEEDHV
ncbi:Cmg1 protein [Saccharomycopsis crataegensis]|uniref:Cmg1 protein n=1 Tax=Saccharomycopsis crataegensis TaxID=43959 RepID=A0AAV5QX65_9ASCO|nr:Cmg1 protein [Saccharomycopsis crataegensis]